MKCKKLLCLFLFVLFPVCLLIAQTNPQLLLMQEILNDSDMSLNRLETNTKNFNQIIQDLSLKVSSMQTTIEMQQRQLKQESANSTHWERIAQMRSQEFEQTLQSLETSFNQSLLENKEKDGQILKLTQTNAKQIKVIFTMGFIIGLAIIFFIAKLAIKIKTEGILSLFKLTK